MFGPACKVRWISMIGDCLCYFCSSLFCTHQPAHTTIKNEETTNIEPFILLSYF